MTTALQPCPVCARHIRISEDACPFCSAPVAGRLAAAPVPKARGRLSRAALLAASTLVASPLACGGTTEAEEGDGGGSGGNGSASGGTQGTGAATGVGGDENVAPVYGAPAVGGDNQGTGGDGQGTGGDMQGNGGDGGFGGEPQGSGGDLVGPVYGLPPAE